MTRSTRRVTGSLNSLEVLQIAVMTRNLTAAAKHLGISQPGVSQHIATLEGRLGQALFVRRHNRIFPTANASRLADAVALGLGHIDQVWDDISTPVRANDLTVACSFGFADQWLMHRFTALRAFMAPVQVRVITSDRIRDLDPATIDVALVWDTDDAPDRPSFPLISEEVFPICSPAFLAANPACAHAIGTLSPEQFLHFEVGTTGFMTWPGWFAQTGLTPPVFCRSAVFDVYPFLIQAVRRGEGIALGWRGLVDRSLAEGEIVRLGPAASDRDVAYRLYHHPYAAADQTLGRLVEWFKSETTRGPA